MNPTALEVAFARLADTARALADAVQALGAAHAPQPKDRVLTVDEVAALLSRSARSVNRAIAAGELVARNFGDGRGVLLSDFEAYLRDLKIVRPRQVRRARALRDFAAGPEAS